MRPQPLTFFGALGIAPSQGLGQKDFSENPPLPIAVPLPSVVPIPQAQKSTVLNEAFLTEGSQIKFHRQDLVALKSLGAGAGGNVTLVQHLPTGLYLARKVIPGAYGDAEETQKSEKRLVREVRIMKSSKSPFIVSFFGASLDEGDVVLLLEYMDLGSLESIYKRVGPIPEDILGCIAVAVLKGLDFLYREKGIVHRGRSYLWDINI
jgi:mitogen-activated protein kinase kinase